MHLPSLAVWSLLILKIALITLGIYPAIRLLRWYFHQKNADTRPHEDHSSPQH